MFGINDDRQSHDGEGQEQAPPVRHWIVERRPHIIFWTGLLLFWLACIDSAHLPIEAILVGPVLMLAGIIMVERDKREMR